MQHQKFVDSGSTSGLGPMGRGHEPVMLELLLIILILLLIFGGGGFFYRGRRRRL